MFFELGMLYMNFNIQKSIEYLQKAIEVSFQEEFRLESSTVWLRDQQLFVNVDYLGTSQEQQKRLTNFLCPPPDQAGLQPGAVQFGPVAVQAASSARSDTVPGAAAQTRRKSSEGDDTAVRDQLEQTGLNSVRKSRFRVGSSPRVPRQTKLTFRYIL